MFETSTTSPTHPRDPVTGRFMSAKVDGVEDGEPATPATERVRATDITRRSIDGSWLTFVRTDEVSDEMIVGDEDLAPSPEDILLAREVEDEDEECEEDGDDMPDRYELMALAAEAEVAASGFSRWLSFHDNFCDFLGCAEDFEDVDESLDDEPVEEVDFSSEWSSDDVVGWTDSHIDDADAFCDRPVVLEKDKYGRKVSFSGPNTHERRRRAELIARMRHARRAAPTWLTKPDWSDEADARLEAAEIAEAKREERRRLEDEEYRREFNAGRLFLEWADIIVEREAAHSAELDEVAMCNFEHQLAVKRDPNPVRLRRFLTELSALC